jgi:DNA polymerase
MRKAADPRDNSVRYTLLYHGASTGRYAGRLIQPQNMPSPKGIFEKVDMDEAVKDLNSMSVVELQEKYTDLMGLISSALRSLIVAPDGCDFISADFNAIEARVVMWVADAYEAVQMFRDGADLYKDMASVVYNVPVDQIEKPARQLGKAIILGAGFGMSWSKFLATCRTSGLDISEELAQKSIDTYRKEKYPEVPKAWDNAYTAVKKAVITGEKVEFNHCVAYHNRTNDFLYITLPSGRSLAYAYPRLEKLPNKFNPKKMENTLTYWVVNSVTKQWEKTTTYGAPIVQNIVQAIARDCMVEGMKRVEKAGYKNIFTVHDELVCAIPKDKGSLEEFISLLEIPPSWAKDLPIKAEGWRGYRYRK